MIYLKCIDNSLSRLEINKIYSAYSENARYYYLYGMGEYAGFYKSRFKRIIYIDEKITIL